MACERLNESSAKKLLSDVDNFLFDCDGVLWDGVRGVIPGSLETVQKLKKLGKRVFYITNNSLRTRAEYLEVCKEHGFPATVEDIACAAYSSALYLKNQQFTGKVYVVGNPAMGKELDAFGIPHIGVGAPTVGHIRDWVDLEWDPDVKCVLVGFDTDITYMKILRAASYLQRPDCLFIATNADTHLPVSDSATRIPDTGTMIVAVGYAAQRKAVVIGKPQPVMFHDLRNKHDLDPSRCVMVGDRLDTDIGLAKTCGLKSLLVLSGVTTEADLPTASQLQNGTSLAGTSCDPPSVPDLYTNCLADLGKFI